MIFISLFLLNFVYALISVVNDQLVISVVFSSISGLSNIALASIILLAPSRLSVTTLCLPTTTILAFRFYPVGPKLPKMPKAPSGNTVSPGGPNSTPPTLPPANNTASQLTPNSNNVPPSDVLVHPTPTSSPEAHCDAITKDNPTVDPKLQKVAIEGNQVYHNKLEATPTKSFAIKEQEKAQEDKFSVPGDHIKDALKLTTSSANPEDGNVNTPVTISSNNSTPYVAKPVIISKSPAPTSAVVIGAKSNLSQGQPHVPTTTDEAPVQDLDNDAATPSEKTPAKPSSSIVELPVDVVPLDNLGHEGAVTTIIGVEIIQGTVNDHHQPVKSHELEHTFIGVKDDVTGITTAHHILTSAKKNKITGELNPVLDSKTNVKGQPKPQRVATVETKRYLEASDEDVTFRENTDVTKYLNQAKIKPLVTAVLEDAPISHSTVRRHPDNPALYAEDGIPLKDEETVERGPWFSDTATQIADQPGNVAMDEVEVQEEAKLQTNEDTPNELPTIIDEVD